MAYGYDCGRRCRQSKSFASDIAYITQARIDKYGAFTLKIPIAEDGYSFYSNLPITADEKKYCYVSGSRGSYYGDGSALKPVDTLKRAFEIADDGGTVVLLDTVSVKEWKTSKKLAVTGKNPITGKIEGGIDLTGSVTLKLEAPVTFENLNFVTVKAEKISDNANRIFACGNKLVMGEGLTMTNPIDVLGGSSIGNTSDSTDITLLSGRYRRVYGGGWNSPVAGDTNITIGGTVNSEYSVEDSSEKYYDSRVFGGGVNSGSAVGGKTHITIKDNAAIAYVVGGGSGKGADINGGETHISVEGGRVMNVYGGTADKETVYVGNTFINMTGGSVEGIFGGSMSQSMTGNTYVTVSGGEVTRRIFGGCYNDWTFSWATNYHVKGSTTVLICKTPSLVTGRGLSSGNKDNSGIFAASRAESNDENEVSYLIFADGTYSTYKEKIGDTTGWGSYFKSFHDYLVYAGSGGSAGVDYDNQGTLKLSADGGTEIYCNNKKFAAGVYEITDSETEIEFRQIEGITGYSGRLTDGGALINADIYLKQMSEQNCILAAIFDGDGSLVSVKKVDVKENGNYVLKLDFTPLPDEKYTARLFVWKYPELRPVALDCTFGPLSK